MLSYDQIDYYIDDMISAHLEGSEDSAEMKERCEDLAAYIIKKGEGYIEDYIGTDPRELNLNI